MSIITVVKENDTLIFSTDSRMMAHDYSGVAYDTQQKIFEIAPSTFIAMSGRKMASEFQVARARELAVELGTNIQEIGAALERESLPCLKVLVERLRVESDETTRQAVAGDTMLHGCMLVGRSAGKLGYVMHSYFVQAGGSIKNTVEAYFEAPRNVAAISGTPARLMGEIAARFACDMATALDPLELVSLRFLEACKTVTPTIGGPWQVVRLDTAGAHWITQAPQAADLASQTAAGTCTATVSFTAPVITGGSITGASIAITTSGGVASIGPVTNGLEVSSGTNLARVMPSAFLISAGSVWSALSTASLVIGTGGSYTAALAPTGLLIGALPSSSPGSKQFWYDPADSNRVKYTP